jgi:SWI/SNF-related matrix-associated actin-dependent regulator of chromatin subfamily A3
VELSEAEQRLYLRVHKEAKAEFGKYTSLGTNWVVRNLLAIMSLLNPLRAICSGGVLREKVKSFEERENQLHELAAP